MNMNTEYLFYLGNIKKIIGKNSAFSSWYEHQFGNCFHVLSGYERWVPVIVI